MSLPDWAQVTPERRAHIERVVALLNQWASAMNVTAAERDRWLRAAWLHDALRDSPFDDPTAHGPAAAERAVETGERDQGVLDAIRYHTVGSAGWDDVGKMLYLADFLEPGRGTNDLTEMAQRVPEEKDAVLQEVARRRIEWVLRSGWRLPAETVAFWNKLTAHQ